MSHDNNHNLLDISILLNQQIDILSHIFSKSIHLGKDEFVRTIFKAIFDVIPEAQKGMFLTCKNMCYTPLISIGYDQTVTKFVSFEAKHIPFQFSSQVKEMAIKFDELDEYPIMKDIMKHLEITNDFKTLTVCIQNKQLDIGVIVLDNLDNQSFSETSKLLLKYYAQLISNFCTLKELQITEKKKNNSIISALVSAIEVKDKYTKGHARRVQEIAINIAIALGLSHQELSDIHTASILHDVGKIGIPDDILMKTGALLPEEYDIVKEHPSHTKHILDKISGFETVVILSHLHHEHYDGNGYPLGLKGDEIPIGAQIIQIADAFDAMTSDRAYRQAMTYKQALEEIANNSGKQFSPKLVKIILKLYG
jgi:polar amino acid transport system substrate-binding protein